MKRHFIPWCRTQPAGSVQEPRGQFALATTNPRRCGACSSLNRSLQGSVALWPCPEAVLGRQPLPTLGRVFCFAKQLMRSGVWSHPYPAGGRAITLSLAELPHHSLGWAFKQM
uniref:Uncharacterized protein n=1 Tax=Meleagris gallopavo TaxID=9103 RepID=A0A803YF17_MELGA